MRQSGLRQACVRARPPGQKNPLLLRRMSRKIFQASTEREAGSPLDQRTGKAYYKDSKGKKEMKGGSESSGSPLISF